MSIQSQYTTKQYSITKLITTIQNNNTWIIQIECLQWHTTKYTWLTNGHRLSLLQHCKITGHITHSIPTLPAISSTAIEQDENILTMYCSCTSWSYTG